MISTQGSKSRNYSKLGCLAFLLVFSFAKIGFAKEGVLEVGEQGDSSISTPKNGQDTTSVILQYGEPKQKIPAIGEPPISKWVYDQFTVYFENDRVIHAVIHKPTAQ